jgi:hypothetical protein
MSKHTPGPWRMRTERSIDRGTAYGIETCEADWKRTRSVVPPLYINEADARLIAAAPDMLEALEEVMSCEENEQMRWAQKARAAIAKARGEK